MKTLKVIIPFIWAFLLFSCNEKENKELEAYDWGKGIYEEPFVGLLDSRPSVFVSSLKYPPFAWFVSDTITLSKHFKVTFNEECIRSNSKVSLEFADSLGNPFKGLSFIVNNKKLSENRVDINCYEEIQELNVTIKISPIEKERVFNGYIIAKPIELDIINDVNMSQEANIIATWKCEQEFGYPIMIWSLWIISIILLVVLLYVLLKTIILSLIPFIKAHISSSTIQHLNMNNKIANAANNDDEKKEEEEDGVKCFRVPNIMGKSKWISEIHPLPPFQRKKFIIHNHWVWGIFPVFEGDCVTLDAYCMSDEFWNLPGQAYERQMKAASLILYKRITDNPLMQNKYTSEQIEALKKGSKNIPGYTWHHKEDWLVMQLVKREEHDNAKPHTGGSYVWNEKHFIEEYGEEWFKNRIPLKRKSLFGIIYDKLFR